MSTQSASSARNSTTVVSVEVARRGVGGVAARAVFRELFGIDAPPLAPSEVSVEVRGVPTALVNALRRTLLDEMPWMALRPAGPNFGAGTTEVHMLPQFVHERISLLRLRPGIPDEVADRLTFGLDVQNSGPATLTVYAGDLIVAGELSAPIFNPTVAIATVEPGKRLVLENIRIARGSGRAHAMFNVACAAAYTHLDIQQHSDDEMRIEGGAAVDLCGYLVPSTVANPRHHRLRFTVPATTEDASETFSVFIDACSDLLGRLSSVEHLVAPLPAGAARSRRAEPDATAGLSITKGKNSGEFHALLRIPGETHTIGELVRRYTYELGFGAGLECATYQISTNGDVVTIEVVHVGDVANLLASAVRAASAAVSAIRHSARIAFAAQR